MTLSKYNEVMENIVITDEMRARLLENIQKEVAGDNAGNDNKEGEGAGSEPLSFQKVNINDFEKKKADSSSGKIIKFVARYGSRVAVFALVMLGAYGVIRLVGVDGHKSMETAAPAASVEMAMEATETTDSADYAYDSEATEETEESFAYEDAAESSDSLFDAEVPIYAGKEDTAEESDNLGASKNSITDIDKSKIEGAKSDDVEAEAAEATEMAAAESSDELTITMAGDVLLHTPVAEAGEDTSGDYNFDFIFDKTRDEISAADIAIVNQEVILGGEDLGVTGYPSFNAPYELGDSLVKAGFDVICHATNHALDKGKKGIINACEFWKKNYPEITVAGINETEEEYDKVRIVERNGIKVAVLNYTYGTNGISLPSDMPYAVDLLEEDKVIADLKYAEENADFTIVCPHWGTEYDHNIDSVQTKWTEIFRENGADLVIGTHPHVIQPIEMLKDSDGKITNNHGDGDMLVYYSIGNFVNWTSGTGDQVADRMVGGLANVKLGRDENGEVCIDDYSIRAIVCHVESGAENVTVYPLNEYTDSMADKNEIVKQDPDFSKVYCEALCNDIWGDLWK